ncbi:DUF4112 domain-containing protein [Arenibaculum sp.]|uniref:DUF4112 domain-containing protein n=1 Tax=Arenibaculum sp. TaxID=2865862 RepID=UPI002E1315BF|nr:DUF4112 domain-containing protein [Arenibaculum sp.]
MDRDSASPATHYERLLQLQRMADLLDSRWRIPGTRWRFGLDGVASVVPVVGDTLTAGFSAYIIWQAASFGVPKWLLGRMIANAGLDWAVGSIPVLGTVFDVAFKANRRNLALLTRHLEQRYTR